VHQIPSSLQRGAWLFVGACVLALQVSAAEVMPPKPARFFNDYAGVVPPNVARSLNEQLAQYERDSSNQLMVAIFQKMQTDSSIEDYATRIYQSWGVGTKEKDNGAVLFVFLQDRKMRIQTGYGLEASLTDAESFLIIDGLKPYFRSNNYADGFSFAVSAMIDATTGEYVGTGKTAFERNQGEGPDFILWIVIGFIILISLMSFYRSLRQIKRGYVYGSKGRYQLPGDTPWWGGGSWGSSGGGGGWSSGGGGGSSWSGGGGSTGGGGASGSW
jgi:uncharacterized protein